MLTLCALPSILDMNAKGNIQASDKPTAALAEEKAREGSVHPLRRETTTNKKSLRSLRKGAARIHEEKNRCDDSLQICSVLSEVIRAVNSPSLLPYQKRFLRLFGGTRGRFSILPVRRRGWFDWDRAVSNILNSNEALSTRCGRPELIPSKARASTRRGKKARLDLRPAGNGGGVTRTVLQALPSSRRSDRPSARPFPNKIKNQKIK